MRARATREVWVERIRSWKTSGKTAEEFSAGQPYKLTTLKWWAQKVKHDLPIAPRIEMTRVEVKPTPKPSTIAVEIGGARVVVDHGFDASLLRAVIEALAARR